MPQILQAQSDLARANARFGWNTPTFMPVSPVEMTEADMLAMVADGATSRSEFDAKDVLIGANAELRCMPIFAPAIPRWSIRPPPW